MRTVDPAYEHLIGMLNAIAYDCDVATQAFYCYLAIHEAASTYPEVLEFVNGSGAFTLTLLTSTQANAYIALGRIYDKTGKHTLHALLDSMHAHRRLLKLTSLRQRKLAEWTTSRINIDEYLADKYEPDDAYFIKLHCLVSKYAHVYRRDYGKARNKAFAHNDRKLGSGRADLFETASTKDFARLLQFADAFQWGMRHLLLNGNKPSFRLGRPNGIPNSFFEGDYLGSGRGTGIRQDIVAQTVTALRRAASGKA